MPEMSDYRVWRYNFITSPSGKKIWQKKLKLEATRKLREEVATPGGIAAELGAHECLVRKWWVLTARTKSSRRTGFINRVGQQSITCLAGGANWFERERVGASYRNGSKLSDGQTAISALR